MPLYQEKNPVSIGYTYYQVDHSFYSTYLSKNEYLNEKPDAMYLIVALTVRNDDKEARAIPPFKLIDENNYEYQTTSKSYIIDNDIGLLDSLNPGVQKQGYIAFDVPQNHTYRLKVSGGYWSSDYALIALNPRPKP